MFVTRLLCPVDFSAQARAALPIAFSLARDYGAAVTLLYVRPAPIPMVGEFGIVIPQPPEPMEPLQARLREYVPANHQGTVDIRVADGDAAEEILAMAKQQRCDLIVMGTHGRSGFGRLLMGSVAEAVLRGAACPVLTIKPAKAEPVPPATETKAEPVIDAHELVVVATASNAVDAEIMRNALNAEGIRCFPEGSNQAGFTGTLGFPVKISVSSADFDRASKIIENREVSCHR